MDQRDSSKRETPVDSEVRQAVRDLSALRALTKSTGNHTTFAQNAIIRKLSPVALTRVAVILAELDGAGTAERKRSQSEDAENSKMIG